MDFLAPSQLPVPIPQSSHSIHSPGLQPVAQLEKLQLQKAPEPSAQPKPTLGCPHLVKFHASLSCHNRAKQGLVPQSQRSSSWCHHGPCDG